MKKIALNTEPCSLQTNLTILVFTEGTVLKPKSRWTLYEHNSYIPIGNAVSVINAWQQQGADIIYCTSRRKKQAEDMAEILKKYGFAGTYLIAREQKERYKDIAEQLQPDILIEDDCRSIGGAWQMCITKVAPGIKEKIKSIVVPEFQGIDKLPMDLEQLQKLK